MKIFIKSLVIASSLFWFQSAFALRCNGNLISTGFLISKVLTRCGEPTERDERQKEIIRRYLDSGAESRINVTVEEFAYDFGATDLLTFLRFENERLVSERTGGYGRQKSNPANCKASSTLLRRGQSELEVKIKCGAPDQENHIGDKIVPFRKNLKQDYQELVSVSVDEWIYDFGLQSSLSVFRFENGILVKVYDSYPPYGSRK